MNTDSRPLLSFIVPVYNVEAYVGECLKSLQSQTQSNIEIICINDGSTDESMVVLTSMAAMDSRIRVFDKENGGVSSARNVGLARAGGEYVAFVDADDWVEPHFAEELSFLAERDAADIVVFSGTTHPQVAWIDNTLQTGNETIHSAGADVLLSRNGCIPLMCNKLYRRDILHSKKITFDEQVALGEDLLFQFAVFPHAGIVTFTDLKLYHYRTQRENSAVSSVPSTLTQFEKHLDLLHRAVVLWRSGGWLEGREESFLKATRFLFFDIFKMRLDEFRPSARLLLSRVQEDFCDLDLENLAKPEPYRFYSVLNKATKEKNGLCSTLSLKMRMLRYTLS